jgi:homoserine dehydrogenase
MRIIFIGFGVVGQSLARIFQKKKKTLTQLYGIDPQTVAVVDSKGAAIDSKGLDLDEILKMKDSNKSVSEHREVGNPQKTGIDVIREMDAEVMFETTPTNILDSSKGIINIESALKAGINVVTTNKGPLARAMPSLMEMAAYNEVELRFSGTVGGGTPFLKLAKQCLQGDRIITLKGILNGTTNYILTQMADEQISMEKALTDAQQLGYAESDPTNDLDGIDAAVKVVILANWIMNRSVSIDNVEIEGIRQVSQKDIKEAKKAREVIKLLGSVDEELSVKPQRISEKDALNVKNTLNAVSFTTEHSGTITLTGKGAGGVETASAALRDLIDIKNNLSIK